MESNAWTGYLAPEGLEEALEEELEGIVLRQGRLFLAKGASQRVHWVQNYWIEPQTISFSSIAQAAEALRSLGPLWAHFPNVCVRRGELIAKRLPFFHPKPVAFSDPLPSAPLGSWTLLDEKTLLCAPRCSSPFMHGEVRLLETKEPPSRAYLKLWELFLKTRKWPKKGDLCFEVGASPGSWTWVLSQMGAHVIAVDRSSLEPFIERHPNVSFLKKDAFSLAPNDFPDVKWVFSDLICYPKKLFAWIQQWLDKEVNLVCTLKFQGKEEYGILKEFEAISGSEIIRLFHHKHELTWVRFSK